MAKSPLDVCGRNLGTFDGWDQADTMCFAFYEFEPEFGIGLPVGDITIDFDKGILYVEVKDIQVAKVDLIEFLTKVPRHDPL